MIDQMGQAGREVISVLGAESRWSLAFHEYPLHSFLSVHQLFFPHDVSFHVKVP